jgi:hypothetical protein
MLQPDIDWGRTHLVAGDDHGRGACTVFAIAKWVEAATGRHIGNLDVLKAYHGAVAALPESSPSRTGLTVPQAFHAATRAGWMPEGATMRRVGSTDLSPLRTGPLIACYHVTSGWLDPDSSGRVSLTGTRIGSHTVCITASYDSGILLEFVNSWGMGWGSLGFGRISLTDHATACTELWQITTPSPSTKHQAQTERTHHEQTADHH